MTSELNELPENWERGLLGDDAVIKGRIGWKGYKKEDLRDTGPVVIGGVNVKNSLFLDISDLKHLTREKFEESPEIILKNGDVLLVQRGNGIGDCGYFDGSIPEATINPTLIIISEFKGDPRFLFYYLTSTKGRENVLSRSSGSSVPAIYQQPLKKLEYPKPPVEIQTKIADFLSSIDEKIELNRQINQTLEQIAQVIFKSWFADFDPVKAKIEAKQNGQDPERAAMRAFSGKTDEELEQLSPKQLQRLTATAALFPDELVDTELGEIPKGWRLVSLYETAEFINGAAFKASDFSPNNEGLPIIKIAELKAGIIPQTKYTTKEVADKYYIDDDEMLYSWSGSPGTSLEVFKWFSGKAILNQHIFRVITDSPEQKYFVFHLLRYLKPKLIAIAENKQTTGLGHVTVADMERLIVPQPEVDILEEFGRVVGQLYENSSVLDKQTLTLIEIRDTMLPELLSGKLDIENKKAAV